MELFDEVFNKASIYDMLFFNIKAVLEYPTLAELQAKNPVMCERWKYLSKTKFNHEIREIKQIPQVVTNVGETALLIQDNIYKDNAIYYPEFTRIVAITYASVESENGQLKRHLKKIANEDEFIVIATFIDVLNKLSSEGARSSPKYFPMFCGHNILNYDIPLLIKRFFKHIDRFKKNLSINENLNLPFILKNCLSAKPWESKVIDTVNVWRFNGNDYTSLMLIADYLELKKTVDLDALPDVSKTYWGTVTDKPEEALEYVSLQSATQTNLIIQLMNELRQR